MHNIQQTWRFLNESPNPQSVSIQNIKNKSVDESLKYLMTYWEEKTDEHFDIWLVRDDTQEFVIQINDKEFSIPKKDNFDEDSREWYENFDMGGCITYSEPEIELYDGQAYWLKCNSCYINYGGWYGGKTDVVEYPDPMCKQQYKISWPSLREIFSSQKLLDIALLYAHNMWNEKLMDMKLTLNTLFEGFWFYDVKYLKRTEIATKIHESVGTDINEPPIDSGMNIENGFYQGPHFSKFLYFGDCRNTVDVDRMWNATQMLNWLGSTKIIKASEVVNKIQGGDRKIPSSLKRCISSLVKSGELDNLDEISCGIDSYQKILAIYCSNTDIHYFFDCVR